MKGFFGGDPNLSHFSAQVPYLLPNETGRDATARRRAQRTALKEAGFPRERYFQYRNKDEPAKAEARSKCEAFAAEWTAKAKVPLEVVEGCFL